MYYGVIIKYTLGGRNCNASRELQHTRLEEQKQQVHPRVEHAQQMCAELHSKELHSEQQNSQALEGRSQWVLAKLYRCTKRPKHSILISS